MVGELTSLQFWCKCLENPSTILLDVRTPQELSQVGMPKLSDGNVLVFVDWQKYPVATREQQFVDEFSQYILVTAPIHVICKSGVRSLAAAQALEKAGYETYNIIDGFEGKNGVGGWKNNRLPFSLEIQK